MQRVCLLAVVCTRAGARGFAMDNNFACKEDYEVLGVKRSSSVQEVRAKYKEAIKNAHPDKGMPVAQRWDNVVVALT